jgi:hypothetical protein
MSPRESSRRLRCLRKVAKQLAITQALLGAATEHADATFHDQPAPACGHRDRLPARLRQNCETLVALCDQAESHLLQLQQQVDDLINDCHHRISTTQVHINGPAHVTHHH